MSYKIDKVLKLCAFVYQKLSVRQFLFKFFFASIGLFFIFLIGYLIGKINFNPLNSSDINSLRFPEAVFDDRYDQVTYLTSLLTIPLLIFIATYKLNAFLDWLKFKKIFFFFLLTTLSSIIFMTLILWDDPFFHQFFGTSSLIEVFFTGVIGYLVARVNRFSAVAVVGAVILIFIIAAISYFPSYWAPHWFHFEPIIYNMAQLQSSHPTLVDGVFSQYGLFNSFIQLVFPSDGNVSTYTGIMALLIFLTLSIPIYIFFKVFKNHWVALGGTIIFLAFFGQVLYRNFRILSEGIEYMNAAMYDDPYFQYFPIRMLFPMLMVGVVWVYIQESKQKYFWLGSILSSIAILWNIDTGIVSFVSWLLLVGFHHLYIDKIKLNELATKVALIFIIAVGVFLIYSILIWLQYGVFPDFKEAFESQRQFIRLGFFMMPAPEIGLWIVNIFLYLYTIAKISLHLVNREATNQTSMLFYICILGLGVFSYYVGRSHYHVLFDVLYPTSILFVLLYAYSEENSSTDWLKRVKNMVFLILFVFSTLQLSTYFSNYYQWQNDKKNKPVPNYNHYEALIYNLSKIDSEIKKKGILIISNWAGALHMQTHIKIPKAWTFPSFEEVNTKDMIAKEISVLRSCKVEYVFLGIESRDFLTEQLRESYRAIQYNPNGLLLQSNCKNQRPNPILEIKKSEEYFIDLTHKKTGFSSGDAITSVSLPQNFNIEFEVTLEDNQNTNAFIGGNHPGWLNRTAGFVIQQDVNNVNTFLFAFGNGKKWSKNRLFYLSPNKRHKVRIIVGPTMVIISVDGRVIVENLRETIFLNTLLPLTVGDYLDKGRLLNGVVHYLKITSY